MAGPRPQSSRAWRLALCGDGLQGRQIAHGHVRKTSDRFDSWNSQLLGKHANMQAFPLEAAMIRRRFKACVSLLAATFTFCAESAVNAQGNNFYAGTASNGQAVNVDLGSIRQVSASSLDFTY